MQQLRFVVLALLVGSLGLLGCKGEMTRRPISGQITFKGEPLDHGRIQFFTTTDPPLPVGGALIENGSYTMPAEFGIEPGTYRVRIDSLEPDPNYKPKPGEMMSLPPSRNRLPDRYHDKSTITVEVTRDGPNRFDFNIEAK
jgi:hypothetical protein